MKHLIAAVALTTLAMPALGADLGMAEPVYVPESVSSSSFDWSGFYAGINGGYGWAEIETVTTTFSDFEGLLGGAQVGYNHSFGQFVLGVEGDIQFSDIDFQQNLTAPFSEDVSLDAFGTIRARAGVAVDRFLPYVTAGIAWGHVTAELSAPGFSEEVDAEFVGFTAGGGLEYAVTDNVSVKGEYLYTDFGSGNFGAGGSDVNLTSHMARVGLNYKF